MLVRVPERVFRHCVLRVASCLALASAFLLSPAVVRADGLVGADSPVRADGLSELPLLTADNTSAGPVAAQCTSDSCSTEAAEAPAPPKHAWLTQHPTIQKLLTLNNAERARVGRAPCTLDPQLCLAAQRHAQWMADTGYYGHSSMGYPEIIFNGPRTAEAANRGWIYSPAHHSIMLSGRRAGFGYAVRNGRTYWVGLFLH